MAKPVVTMADVRAMLADPRTLRAAQEIFNAIGRTKGGQEGEEIEVGVAGALNATLLAGAMMIDLDPAAETGRDLRQVSQDAARLLEMFLHALREVRSETGRPLIETVGSGRNPRLRRPDGKTRLH